MLPDIFFTRGERDQLRQGSTSCGTNQDVTSRRRQGKNVMNNRPALGQSIVKPAGRNQL